MQELVCMDKIHYGLAWVSDLNNLKLTDPAMYQQLLDTVHPARFKVGQVIIATSSLIGIGLAMYHSVDHDKRLQYKPMFLSACQAPFPSEKCCRKTKFVLAYHKTIHFVLICFHLFYLTTIRY